MSDIEDDIGQMNRQTSLINAITVALQEWVEKNGKLSDDELVCIVSTYAFHLPKEKRLSLMFDIMIKTSMSR